MYLSYISFFFRLIKIHRKIYKTSYALKHFSFQSFNFLNDNNLALDKTLNEYDKKIFNLFLISNLDKKKCLDTAFTGIKRFLMNDKGEDLPKNLSKMRT